MCKLTGLSSLSFDVSFGFVVDRFLNNDLAILADSGELRICGCESVTPFELQATKQTIPTKSRTIKRSGFAFLNSEQASVK